MSVAAALPSPVPPTHCRRVDFNKLHDWNRWTYNERLEPADAENKAVFVRQMRYIHVSDHNATYASTMSAEKYIH